MDTKEMLLAQGYQKLDLEIAVGSYEEVPQLDPDLMHVRFIMCHEGTNANGDTFVKESLKNAQHTATNKPIDWEHGQPIIGTIIDSVYKEDNAGVGYIEAVGVIWKFIYPELSSSIKDKASTGELKLSMECYYRDANYKIGDQLFSQQDAEQMGIIPYVGREYMGKKVIRIFNDVIFGGVGVVAKPADKKAIFLSVAKDLSNHVTIGEEVNEEVIMNISKTIAEAINRTVNDFNKKNPSKQDSNAVAIGKYVKAFDKAKNSIISKFNNDTTSTKEQMILQVRSSINTLLAEITSINNSYYSNVASDSSENIEEKLQNILATALNDDYTEAYFNRVEEGYVIYDVLNYSLQHPESVKSFKASYSMSDDDILIDFTNASEITLEKGVIDEMTDQNKSQAELEVQDNVNPEEVVEEVVVAEVVVDQKVDTSELEALVASLKEELATAKSENQVLASKVADFEARFTEMESEKVLASRMSELKEAGIEFTGSRLEKESARIKSMSNDDFADHKELLLEVAGKKSVVTSQEEVEEVVASEEEVEEDIVVEGVSTASLIIEQETHKEIRPFGHLRK